MTNVSPGFTHRLSRLDQSSGAADDTRAEVASRTLDRPSRSSTCPHAEPPRNAQTAAASRPVGRMSRLLGPILPRRGPDLTGPVAGPPIEYHGAEDGSSPPRPGTGAARSRGTCRTRPARPRSDRPPRDQEPPVTRRPALSRLRLGRAPAHTRPGRLLVGCLAVLGIVVVLLLIGGIYVAYNWKGWAATGIVAVTERGITKFGLPQDQKDQVLAQVRQLGDDFKSGKITTEQLGRV